MTCDFFQPLEPRFLLSQVFPSDVEQYELQLINRARANPAAEAARYGIDLNEGLPTGTISATPKQPLAMNPLLVDSARGHSQWMIDNDLFQHNGPGSKDPGARMTDAGYNFVAPYVWGENIAYRATKPSVPDPYTTAGQEQEDLFVDKKIDDRGHRTNMMNAAYKEIGAGIVSGDFQSYNAVMLTTDFAQTGAGSFLTGVAYNDNVIKDNFYSPGEGLADVHITATRIGDGAIFSTTTWSTGGYSLPLNDGQYVVRATGGALGSQTLSYGNVGIAGQNVECDFRPPDSAAIRGFAFQDDNHNDLFDSATEPGIGSVILWIDAHHDGKRNRGELYVRTNSGGAYAFRDMLPGNYRVRETVPAGLALLAPSVGYYTANVLAGRIYGGRNFADATLSPSPQRVLNLVDL